MKKNWEVQGAAHQMHKARAASGAVTSFSVLFSYVHILSQPKLPLRWLHLVAGPRTALVSTYFMPMDWQSGCLKPSEMV